MRTVCVIYLHIQTGGFMGVSSLLSSPCSPQPGDTSPPPGVPAQPEDKPQTLILGGPCWERVGTRMEGGLILLPS